MTNILTIFQGMVMGIAEVIPGVSGSTLALVMGIYDEFIELLHQISEFMKELVKLLLLKSSRAQVISRFKAIDFRFGILLIVGMGVSIALFSHIISELLDTSPQYVYAFFFGLIIASIPIPWGEMKKHTSTEYLILVVSFIITYILLGFKASDPNSEPTLLLLLIGGIVGISGMVLPGVSGSFILLTLGLYDYVIGLVKDLTKFNVNSEQIIQLGVFMCGIVIGFVGFIRVLRWSLKNYPSELLAALIGLMLASLRVLCPFLHIDGEVRTQVMPWEIDSGQLLVIAVSFLAGLAAVLLLRLGSPGRNVE